MGKKREDEGKRNVLLDDVGAPSGANPQKWNVLLRMNKTTECGRTDGSKVFRIVPKKVSYARKIVSLFAKKMEKKRKDEGKKNAMLRAGTASMLILIVISTLVVADAGLTLKSNEVEKGVRRE